MIKLSIIIVNWNTAKLLSDCLKSLEFEVRNLKFEIETIVVDNGSTDDSILEIKNSKIENSLKIDNCKLKIIENESNLGFARGNNIGIKQARGEYIMLLNSDTIVKKGAIEKLVDSLDESADEVAAVSPLVLNSDESVQKDPCFLKFPSPMLVLFYYNSLLKKIVLKLFPKLLFSITDFSKPSFVDQLPGAAMMIRKKVLDETGGLDEKFEIYFEDSDLCMRMKKAGYLLLLEPSAKVVHLGRQSIKPLVAKEGIEKFYLLNFESLFRFCKKHYSPIESRIIIFIVFLNLLFSGKIGLIKKILSPNSG